MKTWVFLLLLLAAAVVGTLAHYTKFKSSTHKLGGMAAALKGAKEILTPGASLYFAGTEDREIRSMTRYVLAPRILTDNPGDTTLFISFAADSLKPPGNHITWSHSDDRLFYAITTNR